MIDKEVKPSVMLELLLPYHNRKTVVCHRLADNLEIKYETGLRRKEVSWLENKQYFPKDVALENRNRHEILSAQAALGRDYRIAS